MNTQSMTASDLRPILIIEDSPEDYEALTRALARAGARNLCYRFSYGEDALDLLKHRGRFFKHGGDAPPALVLLDLNLPGTNGHRVLKEIRSDQQLAGIPVIILSSSYDPAEVEACYRAGANSYVVKPAVPEAFTAAIRRIKEFWLDTAALPDPANQTPGTGGPPAGKTVDKPDPGSSS